MQHFSNESRRLNQAIESSLERNFPSGKSVDRAVAVRGLAGDFVNELLPLKNELNKVDARRVRWAKRYAEQRMEYNRQMAAY